MNRQNFEARDRFPLSTQALGFMQDMILASARLALIGGDRYILSGCAATGSTVAPGVIVTDGEIMPFDGGAKGTTITVVETPVPVSANGLTFGNARVTRKAIFATGTGANYLPWADFRPLRTNRQLEEAKATVKYVDDEIAKLQAGNIPKGVIVMWSGAIADIPPGWQLCDYSLIPGGGGKRTPDLRGRFVVGYNLDEPDYSETGKQGGNRAVALSPDNMPPHRHLNGMVDDDWKMFVNGCSEPIYQGTTLKGEGEHANRHQGYTDMAGKSVPFDVRPPYYVLAFIIKI